MAAWSSRTGQTCAIGETGTGPGRAEFLPLRAGERRPGVLELVHAEGGEIGGERERLLLTFANGAALALEQDRLAAEERAATIARESDRLKSALLSSVSHDLRTPLAGIKAAATSLLQPDIVWTEEDRHAFAADIDAEAYRLTRLVANLLDLSRIEAGAIVPNLEWEDVEDLAARVVHRMRLTMPGRDIRLIAGPVPPVRVDVVQMEQVLTNLVENALRYSDAASPVDIRVHVNQSPAVVEIAVADRGIGIPEAELAHIFDTFYRVAQRGRRMEGTGMGLAIVRGLIEVNHGTVSVASEPGQGSTFTVSLPIEPMPVSTDIPGSIPAP
jgi:two-component system, OmpR family, sensor histidine kinase KdpD